MVSLVSRKLVFKCSFKFNLLSRNIPKCFWREVRGTTIWWKNKGGCSVICTLQERISWCACLIGSRVKFISHWNAYSPIFFRSLFSSIFKASTILTSEGSEVKRLSFITQFKIEFLLLFTGCRKVLRKMPTSKLDWGSHLYC